MKKFNCTLALGLFMASMLFVSCGNEDNTDGNGSSQATTIRQVPASEDFVKTITDTGFLRLDKADKTWYLEAEPVIPEDKVLYDGGTIYYLHSVPEQYQVEGKKVTATMDCYVYNHFNENVDVVVLAGYDYYDAVIKTIDSAK